MEIGHKVRLKPDSALAQEWEIPLDCEGTIMCRYRIVSKTNLHPERVDVRFGESSIVWGAPAGAYLPLAQPARA